MALIGTYIILGMTGGLRPMLYMQKNVDIAIAKLTTCLFHRNHKTKYPIK
jgi:hypothetical protein